MGQIRLYVRGSETFEKTLELPPHWDELDDDEKKEWAEQRLAEFGSTKINLGYQITE